MNSATVPNQCHGATGTVRIGDCQPPPFIGGGTDTAYILYLPTMLIRASHHRPIPRPFSADLLAVWQPLERAMRCMSQV